MTRGRYGVFSSSPGDEPRAGRDAAAAPSLLFLGLCPAIAVSARVIDALWISAGVILVLLLSNLAMSLLARDGGPRDRADTPAALLPALLITSFLTAFFEAVLLVRVPSASASLGIYAPLVAVNCLVLGGVGGPSVGGPSPRLSWGSVVGSLGRGTRFALALVLIALVRELLGAGTITLFPVASFGGTVAVRGLVDEPVRALGLAGGALLCLGYLAGAVRAVTARAATARSATARAATATAAGKAAGGESST